MQALDPFSYHAIFGRSNKNIVVLAHHNWYLRITIGTCEVLYVCHIIDQLLFKLSK